MGSHNQINVKGMYITTQPQQLKRKHGEKQHYYWRCLLVVSVADAPVSYQEYTSCSTLPKVWYVNEMALTGTANYKIGKSLRKASV